MAKQDTHNYSSSSPHRLPTLSATQALKNLSSTPRSPIPTNLNHLDDILQCRDDDIPSQGTLPGGISRGEVTEIFGPPGIGKTSLALQITANVLASGNAAVWVDTSYHLNGSTLKGFLATKNGNDTSEREGDGAERVLNGFHHFFAPTLPHLFALLSHPCKSFPPSNTRLLVVDNISTPFSLAFPRSGERSHDKQTPIKKYQATQWAANRRWAAMEKLISDLGKLAATENIAIVLISQMTTRIRDEARAVLYPAIAGNAWESGIATRIVLFRDWLSQDLHISSQGEDPSAVRFAGVTKAKNVFYEGMGRLATFRIKSHGLEEEPIDAVELKIRTSSTPPPLSLKRRHSEVADSESETGDATSDHDFGWDDEVTHEAGILMK